MAQMTRQQLVEWLRRDYRAHPDWRLELQEIFLLALSLWMA
jgi:hypothetical protein